MKKLITILIIAVAVNVTAQVAIGKENPDPTAILDVESTEKGFLPPRMTTAQRDAINSGSFTEGLIIYNTDINCIQYWNTTLWVSFCDGNTDPGGGGEDPPINYRLGGSGEDFPTSIQQTSDGGYIVAGRSTSSANGDVTGTNKGEFDSWIVKFDASGNKVWDKLYGGSGSDGASFIQQTSDGGYIIAGYSTSSANGDVTGTNKGDGDCWIVKLDASGNKIWDKLYGGSAEDSTNSIQQTSDGGYIIAGTSQSSASGDVSDTSNGNNDYWIVKLDASGNKIWDKLYGGSGIDLASSIQQTTDGGYIIAGTSQSSASGDVTDTSNGNNDYWIVKLDASGNKIWDKLYGGSGNDWANSIQKTTDGGYIVAGYSDSSASGDVSGISKGIRDYWVLKLDAAGNKSWDKLYGGNSIDDAFSVQQTADGGYIIAGYSLSSASGDVSGTNKGFGDYWIVKLDASGNKVWDKLYGGSFVDQASSIWQTSSGGYIVAGYSGHLSAGNGDQTGLISRGGNDYWVLTLDENGNLLEP
ncbi:autotransporter outer membrane beta-barrel domain-containing protein [Moheibacter sediminis]|uniref:FG-GAP repeat-containing protein n=1 Tax=Moheibacter sediminis TaxID=1434700 RepID=A0A1W2AR48_9FLAO|nr:hypothetical protein [Moheibacter sediminis]SMC63143.1 hypothetical protein SAMN06296427_10520 [Moheibacter sediminis]